MRAHHPKRNRMVRDHDDLVTSQGTYPKPWATDLATIFGWDDVLEASRNGDGAGAGANDNDATATAATAAASTLLPKTIALDGANIAWSLAGAYTRSLLSST
jgi:hypothetical protein